jgi:S-adenosylhomocysteine hydrolase
LNKFRQAELNPFREAMTAASRMPCVQVALSMFETSEAALRNVHLFSCLHVLETVEIFAQTLSALGLPQSASLLGKVYSTNPAVFRRLSAADAPITLNRLSASFDSHRPFDHQYAEHVQTVAERAVHVLQSLALSGETSLPQRVVLMDDGGALLTSVNSLINSQPTLRSWLEKHLQQHGFPVLVGGEQTSSGWARLQSCEVLHFPIFNVARSWAKLTYESPNIAAFSVPRVIHHIKATQETMGTSFIPKHAIILGAGAIGKSIAQVLQVKLPSLRLSLFDPNVTCYQCDQNLSSPISFHSSTSELNALLPTADVVIGATGSVALHPTQFDLLPDVSLLMSLSSSDRELSAPELRLLVPRTSGFKLFSNVLIYLNI